MPTQPIGDLLVTLKLDDAEYKQKLTESIEASRGLVQTTTQPLTNVTRKHRELGTAVKESTKQTKNLTELAREGNRRFGVMSNTIAGLSSGFRVLNFTTGAAIIDFGRMGLYAGRAATAGGSLAAAITTLGSSVKFFLQQIGPLGIALLVLTAAWAVYSTIVDTLSRKSENAKRKLESFVDAFRRLSAEQLAAGFGGANLLTPAGKEARKAELRAQFPDKFPEQPRFPPPSGFSRLQRPPSALSETEVALERQVSQEAAVLATRLFTASVNRTETLRKDLLILRGQRTEYDNILNKTERAFNIEKDRLELYQKLSTQFGTKKPSDFLPFDHPLRSLLLLQEKLDEEPESRGFGISTRKTTGFRFGTGPAGSVIGEQHETTGLLRSIREINQRQLDTLGQINSNLSLDQPYDPYTEVPTG